MRRNIRSGLAQVSRRSSLGPRSQTLFGNVGAKLCFASPADREVLRQTRNRVSGSGFPNRVWEPGSLQVLCRAFGLAIVSLPRGPAACALHSLTDETQGDRESGPNLYLAPGGRSQIPSAVPRTDSAELPTGPPDLAARSRQRCR